MSAAPPTTAPSSPRTSCRSSTTTRSRNAGVPPPLQSGRPLYVRPPMPSVGTNIPHDSARGHVSGESVYIDDMPPARGELLVDFVWSPVAHGRIRAIDLDAARRLDGVVALLTHRDLHHNRFGAIIQDELLLAEDEVTFIGQPIVVLAAEARAALRAAKLAIELDIETLEPVFTIDEARRRKQFIGSTMHIVRGDVESAFASAKHILEGSFANGG